MSERELPLVPARMVNEYAYCPRLFYLEWIHGEWAENADTLEGAQVHARVEAESGRLPPPELLAPGDRFVARGLPLASERLGLVASARASMGVYTTAADIDALAASLERIVARFR